MVAVWRFREDVAGIAGAALFIDVGQLVGGDVNRSELSIL